MTTLYLFKQLNTRLLLCVFLLFNGKSIAQNTTIGSTSFIHLEKKKNVWWFVDGDGKKFVSMGMNHIDKRIRFAEYNKDFWVDQFGESIFKNGKFNFLANDEIKKWMDQIVEDHKKYGFNTIAFHRPMFLPDEYFNEQEIYFLGKIKIGDINAGRVKRSGRKFPDVFSLEFKLHAEKVAKEYCSKHQNSRFLIGYTYDDLPSYSLEEYYRKIKKAGYKGDLLFHPWVIDIIQKKGVTTGKKIWTSILKAHYITIDKVNQNYGLTVSSWQELEKISIWNNPQNIKLWQQDQTEMLKKIVRQWHHMNRYAIRLYDSNHLILGDKISCHGQGHPDWVYEIVGEYVDVLLIQDYDFFTPSHVNKIEHYHKLSGLPILNGDHSYSYTVPEMYKAKGLPVNNHHAVGEEYYTYLRGISNIPYMLGWHNCGYIEQWKGSRTDKTGKEQTGFFDPFGKPRLEALENVKKANFNANLWHQQAGENDHIFSERR